MYSIARITIEMPIVLLGAAAAAEAGQLTGTMSMDDVICLWCVVGGCLGAICSLHFFRVPQGPHAHVDIAWQFGVNMILSGAFSPLLVPTVAKWTGLPEGMKTAIPTALAVGIIAQRVVARLLPVFQKVLDARASKVASELGACEPTKPGDDGHV